MTIHTRVSGKGQVVIPKDVRDRHRFAAGDQLEVIDRPDGVLLRKSATGKTGRSDAEIMAEVREIASRYKGPPVTIAEMNETIAQGWATGFHEKE